MDESKIIKSHKSIISQDSAKDNAILLTTHICHGENDSDIVLHQELAFITKDQVIGFNLSGDMIIISEKLKNLATELDNVLFEVISMIAEEEALKDSETVENVVDIQPELCCYLT